MGAQLFRPPLAPYLQALDPQLARLSGPQLYDHYRRQRTSPLELFNVEL
jgi:hypothetical protein